MKKIKVTLLLLLLLVLLSGCTVESNVIMDEYGNVSEKVSFNESILNLGDNEEDAKRTLDSTISKYKAAFKARGYSYKVSTDSSIGTAVITNEYDNIYDYFESTIFSQYVYKQMKWEDVDGYYEINNVTEHIPYCEDCSDWPALPMIKVSITLPIAASEHNADEVNGNTYVWIYDDNTPATKNFHLKIDKSLLKENEIRVQNSKKTKNTLSIIFKVLIVIVIVAVGVIFILSLIRKYRENKIEY